LLRPPPRFLTGVYIYMGQTWGKSIKDQHYVSLIAADESGETTEGDPLVERLRQHITLPMDDLISKAMRNCTSLHDGQCLELQTTRNS
jgi:hypothetical protein